MEDVLFPDNPKREARVYELAADIGSLIHDLTDDAAEIKRLLDKLDKEIRDASPHRSRHTRQCYQKI